MSYSADEKTGEVKSIRTTNVHRRRGVPSKFSSTLFKKPDSGDTIAYI